MLSKTPISDRITWKDARPPWDGVSSPLGDMPTRAFKQAILVCRYDVHVFAGEFERRTRLSMNAAFIAVELWSEAVTLGRWTNYSRSDDFYARIDIRESKMMTKRRVCGGVEELSKAGLIDDWRHEAFNFGEQSAMRARTKLVHIVQDIIDAGHRPYPHRPERLLVLRDAAGETMKLKDSAQTRREARELNLLNYGICQSIISNACGVPLVRIYNLDRTLKRGGRCYAQGMLYQGWSRERRAEIVIDGAPNVEWDFGSIHGFMLYGDRGLTPPSDCYDLDFWNRDLQKSAFNILINAADYDQAIYALARKKTMLAHAAPGSADAMAAAAQLISEMRIRHRAIEDAFCSDAGAYLQKREADIVVEVMLAMRKRGETTLPVHDSIMCREWVSDWLVEEMRKAADRAGLFGIRIEKVEPKRPAEEDAVTGDYPMESTGLAENVMSYSFFSSSSSLHPASTVLEAIPDATIQDPIQLAASSQNLVLTTRTETAVEVLSQAKPNDRANKTVVEPQALQDETQPPSHAHSRHTPGPGATRMLKLDLTTPLKIPTHQETLQDDAGKDSLSGGTDTNLVSRTPTTMSGINPTSMWSQPAWTPKPKTMAATSIPPGVDQMSPFYRPMVTAALNAPENPDPIPMVIDTAGAEESILDVTSDLADGSNPSLVEEESIQVAETESEEVGNLNQVPVIHTVGDGNLTPENNDLIMAAEISVSSKESIQEASSTFMVGGNLNQEDRPSIQVAGIESDAGDLLPQNDMELTSGSRNLNQDPETVIHDRSGHPFECGVDLHSSGTKPSISGSLEPASLHEAAVSAISAAYQVPVSRLVRGLSRLSPDDRQLVMEALKPIRSDEDYLPKPEATALRTKAWRIVMDSYIEPGETVDDHELFERHLRDRDSLPNPKCRSRPPAVPDFKSLMRNLPSLSFEPVRRGLSGVRR